MNFKSFKIRWVIALSFALIITLAIIFNITSIHGIARAAMSPTIVSDMADYSPGSTVNLTGAGWASGESVHIYVNDSVGNTWNLNSNPDPVADANGGFTYSFSLPNSFIANYTVMATGATSGTATMTFTDSNCPSLSGKVQSNLVGASSTTSGNTLTYTFSSVSETQTELGVPGLIDYCVYPTGSSPLLPDNSNVNNVQATGANGFAWVYDTGTNNFSFHRKDGGNADNIPLDGKTVTMGTATWSGSVPTGQTILLHINDAAECDKLYGGNPGTCFVLPGNPQQQAKDLTVSKTATPSFTRTYNWDIKKSVDPTERKIADGGTATFSYTVDVNETGFTDSAWKVTGTITVSNPNGFEDIVANVSDAVDNGGGDICIVTGGSNVKVPHSGSVNLDYSCTYPSSGPTSSSGTNTATASWDKTAASTPTGKAQGTKTFDFTTPTTTVNKTISVTDSYKGTLGTLTATDSTPFASQTFTYTRTETGTAGTCKTYPNTATIKETGQTADASVQLCVGADLTVSKTATPSFTRTFKWGITKSVDQTQQNIAAGGTATFKYTVSVTHDSGKDSGWTVSGKITVSNPNDWEDIPLTGITDAVDNGATSCTFTNGSTTAAVPAGGSVTLDYTCTYTSAPSKSSGTNTATATWDKNAASTLDGSASGSADFTFVAPTTVVDGSVTVTDSLADPSTLGTVSSTDKSPTTFTYSHMVTGTPGTCVSQDNTATFTTNTSGTKGLDSKSVQLCVAVDLTVSKVAIPSFTRTYSWGITKDVDQTKVTNSSGSATFKYTVNVTHDGGTDSGWQVTGKITVSNPNHFESISKVQVTDTLDNGGTCVIDTSAFNGTLGPNESTDLPYTCTYLSSGPTSKSGTNTATVIWDQQAASTKDGSASKDVPFAFDTGDQGNPTVIDGSVTVTDSLGGTLGTVKSSNPSPTSFTYSRTVIGTPGKCVTQDNKATFTTNTYGTTGSASKSVQLCVGADLTVSKVAIPSFTRTYNWSIAKNVDKTLVEQTGGGTATFNYTVNVNETGFTDSKWMVSGTITVSNPNDFEDVTGVNVTDAINNGGTCTVTNGTNLTIAAGGAPVTLDYTCNYASAPSPLTGGTNTATAKWDQTKAFTPSGNASGMANVDFEGPTSEVNKTIAVTDTFNGATNTLGTLTATGTKPFTTKTYTYSRTVTVPTTNCVKYTNTAKIVETGQSASQTIEVCGPANTGALTMGFWQNKNGQGIIAKSGPSSGTCALTTWLRQYAPFQDLSATAPCGSVGSTSNNDVVGYVYNIIKAANASGSSMNAMLKAQMLATALDVYFGGGPGGNPINAPKPPIGSVSIDLTLICKVADSSSGTSNCSGSYNDVRSAFGVVPPTTSLTVSQMLTYAASQSNAGGLTWYGNVKATQEMAKNAFDAINNQVAFAP